MQFEFQINLLTNPYIKQIEIAKNVTLKYVSMDWSLRVNVKNALTDLQNNILERWLSYFRRIERNSAASTLFSKLSDRIFERQYFWLKISA